MKFKTITSIALLVFISFFAVLFFLNPNQNSNKFVETTIAPKNILTIDEVSKHNTSKDCYLIVKNVVYDVSSFVDKHPGGVFNISSKCGQEATKIFSDIHSNFAWNLLKDFYVADLVKK